MSTERKDGGPAFPRQTYDYYPSLNKTHAGPSDPGMSLRDFFAAQSIGVVLELCRGDTTRSATIEERVAAECYRIADAMIAEREKVA